MKHLFWLVLCTPLLFGCTDPNCEDGECDIVDPAENVGVQQGEGTSPVADEINPETLPEANPDASLVPTEVTESETSETPDVPATEPGTPEVKFDSVELPTE